MSQTLAQALEEFNRSLHEFGTTAMHELGETARECQGAMKRFAFVCRTERCRTCYLPMRRDILRLAWYCDVCGSSVTEKWIAERRENRLLRLIDRVTGMTT